MSMLLMVKAMQSKVGNPLRKLVLIKLADNANDFGECWPSYQHIADQCEISKRSVMVHISSLIDAGFLRKEKRLGGVKGNKSNLYTLMLASADNSLPSANAAPPSESPAPPPSESPAPRISHSLEPVMEPVMESLVKNKNQQNFDFSEWPEMPSSLVFNDWVKQRKLKRAAITQTVINQFGKELTKAYAAGVSVDECLSEAMEAGWSGFKYQWMINRNSGGNKNKSDINQIANAALEYLHERQ